MTDEAAHRQTVERWPVAKLAAAGLPSSLMSVKPQNLQKYGYNTGIQDAETSLG